MIKVFGEVFLLHRKLVKTQRNGVIMYWAMQYIGKAEDKIQFNYKVKYFAICTVKNLKIWYCLRSFDNFKK